MSCESGRTLFEGTHEFSTERNQGPCDKCSVCLRDSLQGFSTFTQEGALHVHLLGIDSALRMGVCSSKKEMLLNLSPCKFISTPGLECEKEIIYISKFC